jgi:dipeptide/tripeptide permease
MVAETKSVLNVLVLYLPIPLFWALHAQQSSRWVFQATKLNGNIGFYTIKPDQMIVLNSFLGLLSIPIFEQFFYPTIARCGLKTPLQKITLGGIFAAVSFILAAMLEYAIGKETELISILWMFPQYLVMAMAEVLVYTANLNFSYTEAPESMKSVMMCCMYLATACGSLIVVIISGVSFFQSQVYEFIFFAVIMLLDIFIFAILASRYKYRDQSDDKTAS